METKISAGSYDLNKWLHGGYEKDIITTICGNPGSGKTNLCLCVTASQAKKGNKVIFIDTEGGFSVDRFKQMAGEEWQKALENVLILKPTSFEEQWDAFGVLSKELKNDKQNRISLIVVDGMTMLYRLVMAEFREDKARVNDFNGRLARQMRMLAEIARKKNIPVIITNQVYNEFLSQEDIEAGKIRGTSMVGGDIMKYWSKCIIELKNERGKRIAFLRKHRSLREGELSFEIYNLGIRKRGWL